MNTPRILILGGGLMGCAAVRTARRAGGDTVLIESRQRLGHELTATGHEWLASGACESTIQLGALSKSLLSEQLALGTKLLLNARAGGILLA